MQRVAVVTGGSRGIGKAIAAELARQGMMVRSPGRSELDLADADSVSRWLAGASAKQVDVLVNNAGINELGALAEISEVAWQSMLQVNLSAPLAMIRGLMGPMMERGWGRIVSVSSIWSVLGRERRGGYAATKAAINGLTRVAAVEGARSGVLVNAVAPGYVATELTRKNNSPQDISEIEKRIPAGRLAEPDEIARLVAWLCSEGNTYVTGQTIVADGGFSIV